MRLILLRAFFTMLFLGAMGAALAAVMLGFGWVINALVPSVSFELAAILSGLAGAIVAVTVTSSVIVSVISERIDAFQHELLREDAPSSDLNGEDVVEGVANELAEQIAERLTDCIFFHSPLEMREPVRAGGKRSSRMRRPARKHIASE